MQLECLEQFALLATVIVHLEHVHLLRLRVDGALGASLVGEVFSREVALRDVGPGYGLGLGALAVRNLGLQ